MNTETYGRRDLSGVMPNNINEEAVVFRGLTSTEIMFVTLASFAFWLIVCTLVASMFGRATIGVGFAIIFVMISVVAIGTLVQRLKRGRPPGYYQQVIVLFLAKYKLKRSSFIIFDGTYSMGRSKQVILVSKHLKVNPETLEDNYE